MVRNYVRKTPLGKLAYLKTKPPEVGIYIQMIKDKKMTINEMSSKLGISWQTAASYVRDFKDNKSLPKVGHPTVFTDEEELMFQNHIIQLSEFGFQVCNADLRMIIYCYLEELGIEVPVFQNNIPGESWINGFLSRHPDLPRRFTSTVSQARSGVKPEAFIDYMNNFEALMDDVPAENIFIYDEINISEDPERKKNVRRRTTKYPETNVNAGKSGTSVMFCGNAAGTEVPPYFVFKSEHLWSTWTEGGPEGARYNRTSHGWFDTHCFEDWFISQLLPILRNLSGKKVVIGDNLSGHISIKVLRLCKEEDIHIRCLPPDSGQPLHLAYFRPLTSEWRMTLIEFKESEEGRRFAIPPKNKVASLLKICLDGFKTRLSDRLQEGFQKCGIYPFIRIPESVNVKVEIDCGSDSADEESLLPVKKQKMSETEDRQSSDRADDVSTEEVFIKEEYEEEICENKCPYVVHDYVIVNYDDQRLPGQILSFTADRAVVSLMIKSKKSWKWPLQKNNQSVLIKDIIKTVEPLHPRGAGYFLIDVQ